MPLHWIGPLLETYYTTTLPYRCLATARRACQGRARVSVLFYHRVADTHPNPWTISQAGFARQIDWLARHFDLVSLAEAQRRIIRGSRRPAVSITFDDGYAENCEHALPLLIQRNIPCTYFVTLKNVVEQTPFPHDVERGQPLPPNTAAQLRELSLQGVEIAAHTRTHADLGQVDDTDVLYDEIVLAGQELAELVGRRVRYFAFPFGQRQHISDEAVALARRAGYEAVCSAYGGKNERGDDPFHLRRIHGDPLLPRVKNWLTADPRYLLRDWLVSPAAAAPDRPTRKAVPA